MLIGILILGILLALLLGAAGGAVLTIQYALTATERQAMAARIRGDDAGPSAGGPTVGRMVGPPFPAFIPQPSYFEKPGGDDRKTSRTA